MLVVFKSLQVEVIIPSKIGCAELDRTNDDVGGRRGGSIVSVSERRGMELMLPRLFGPVQISCRFCLRSPGQKRKKIGDLPRVRVSAA